MVLTYSVKLKTESTDCSCLNCPEQSSKKKSLVDTLSSSDNLRTI